MVPWLKGRLLHLESGRRLATMDQGLPLRKRLTVLNRLKFRRLLNPGDLVAVAQQRGWEAAVGTDFSSDTAFKTTARQQVASA